MHVKTAGMGFSQGKIGNWIDNGINKSLWFMKKKTPQVLSL
jgi:hypothetical protein